MNKSIACEIGDVLHRHYNEETSNLFWDKIFKSENERELVKAEDVSVVRRIVMDASREIGCILLPVESYRELLELICAKYGIKY